MMSTRISFNAFALLVLVTLCASLPGCDVTETTSEGMSVPLRGARVVVYMKMRSNAFAGANVGYWKAVAEGSVLGFPVRKTLVEYDTQPLKVEALNDSTARVSMRGIWSRGDTWKTFTIPYRWLSDRARSVFGGGQSSSPRKAAGCWCLYWHEWGRDLPGWGDTLELRPERARFAGVGDYAYRIDPPSPDRPKTVNLSNQGGLAVFWEHGFPEHWWQPIDDYHFMITLRRPAALFPKSGRRIVMWIGPPDVGALRLGYTMAGPVYTYREDATEDNVGPQDTWVYLKPIPCSRRPRADTTQ